MSSVAFNPEQGRPLHPFATFTLPLVAVFGGLLGFIGGQAAGLGPLEGFIFGAVIAAALAFGLTRFVAPRPGRWLATAICAALGFSAGGFPGALGGIILGALLGWAIYWLHRGDYRRGVPVYATSGQVLWHNSFKFIFCAEGCIFKI